MRTMPSPAPDLPWRPISRGGCQLELEFELGPEEAGGVEDEELEEVFVSEEVFVAAPSGVLDFPSDFASVDVAGEGFSASMAFFRDSEG